MPSVVLLNGPHARSSVHTAVNRLMERCLLGSPSLARKVVFFSGRRLNTGQLRLRVVRMTHGSCGTRLTKSSSRRSHPSSHTVLVIWRCTSLVRLTRFAPTLRRRPTTCCRPPVCFRPVYVSGDIRQLISRAPRLGGIKLYCDLDPAPTWLVKRAIDVLEPVIAAVCNASLQSGYFPQSRKLARVTARLMKFSIDPDDLNYFRPISNLTFLSKIEERVVTKQFTSHAALNGLFPERQSVYRQFHFTESAVLALHNDIVSAIDQGEVTGLVLLDLSSAFNTVDHASLLSILEPRFSVTAQSLAWFCLYLTDRAVHRCLLPSLVRLSRYH